MVAARINAKMPEPISATPMKAVISQPMPAFETRQFQSGLVHNFWQRTNAICGDGAALDKAASLCSADAEHVNDSAGQSGPA
jgi:hypothetical protein